MRFLIVIFGTGTVHKSTNTPKSRKERTAGGRTPGTVSLDVASAALVPEHVRVPEVQQEAQKGGLEHDEGEGHGEEVDGDEGGNGRGREGGVAKVRRPIRRTASTTMATTTGWTP